MHFYKSGSNLSLSYCYEDHWWLNYFVYFESSGDLLDQT